MADRIFAEEKVIDLFRDLTLASQTTRNSDFREQPFSELKLAFLWAVSIGVHEKHRTVLEGKKEGLFRWANLDPDELSFLQAIALAETEDINVLTDIDMIQMISEEYANFGIRALKEYFSDGSGNPLWKLVYLADTKGIVQ